MEVNNHNIGESPTSVPLTQAEAATLDIIRTETVLSRMPVHNLAKKGSISIKILKKTAAGEVELLWQISPSRDYGEPRQLAYKLDTIIINQRIDEAGRPLPKMLRLGSLNEVCAELNLATHAGQNAKDLKRAFLQNASAFITAKFNYKGNDGSERRLEAAFTRYGVIFTGEKLPDGRKADAVYIIFNEPFWEVLNNAPVRPLDRAYMKELPPAAQRFYEIVSRKIYAALKNNYPNANISYSEYCQFSAQLRHTERQRVQDQMAKIIRHHKKAGYITAVKYEATIDEQNQPDWIMYLTPGPKALAEFAVAHGGRKPKKLPDHDALKSGDHETRRPQSGSRHQRSTTEPAMPPPVFDPKLIAEFTRRGITEQKAVELLSKLQPAQDVLAQLESAEQPVQQLQNPLNPVRNPAGFYIRLIERNTPVPDGFETNARRKAREEKERKERERRAAEDAREELDWEYNRYSAAEVDRYIQANPAEFESLKNAKAAEDRAMRPTSWPGLTETSARIAAKSAIQQKLSLLTFEEFADHKKQGIDFSLKPVGVSPAAESPAIFSQPEVGSPDAAEMPVDGESAIETPLQPTAEEGKDVPQKSADHAPPLVNSESPVLWPRDPVPAEDTITEAVAITSPVEDVAIHQVAPATTSAPPSASVERGAVSQAGPEKPAPPVVSDPAIELAAEYPEAEPGSESHLV